MKEADGLREEVEKLKAKVGELEAQVADGAALTKKAEAAAEAATAKADAMAKAAGEWRVTCVSAAGRHHRSRLLLLLFTVAPTRGLFRSMTCNMPSCSPSKRESTHFFRHAQTGVPLFTR